MREEEKKQLRDNVHRRILEVCEKRTEGTDSADEKPAEWWANWFTDAVMVGVEESIGDTKSLSLNRAVEDAIKAAEARAIEKARELIYDAMNGRGSGF